MKKLLLTLAVAALSVCGSAQQFVLVNGQPILASEIESITYAPDDQFRLLPDVVAADAQTSLFSQALELTGLADSLKAYYDFDYERRYEREHLSEYDKSYFTGAYEQYAEMLRRRYVKYTVFAETDSVFRAHGITSLSDLQAYAKEVYDAVFPEDAAVSDPTDRRHSLNRFVAYHLLPFGSTSATLTAYPGYFRRMWADVADWYETLLPHASLKVSCPLMQGIRLSNKVLFLNRRGLQDRADKYGLQIRGAQLVQEMEAENGTCYLIDDLLVYDRQTQEQVLQERWRLDFVTLSPDFMNAQTRTNVAWNGESTMSKDLPAIGFATGMKNFSWDQETQVRIIPARFQFWSYGGDQVDVSSETGAMQCHVDLPTMPAGEWELRLGTCFVSENPVVQITLDEGDQLDTLVNLSVSDDIFGKIGWHMNSSHTKAASELAQMHRARIDEFLCSLEKKFYLPAAFYVPGENWSEDIKERFKTYYIPAEDIENLIGQQVLVGYEEDGVNYVQDKLLDVIYEQRNDDNGAAHWYLKGTEQETDLPQSIYFEAFCREAYRLNGFLVGPKEYAFANANAGFFEREGTSSNSQTFDGIPRLSRRILGRFRTDGRTRHKLHIQTVFNYHGRGILDLDYLELCPVSIADHQSIPED